MNILSLANRFLGASNLTTIIEREIDSVGLGVNELNSKYLSKDNVSVIQVSARLASGVECAGLGVDSNKYAALLKATSEYFERKAVIGLADSSDVVSTNGVASHRFALIAQRAAYLELAERDSFLSHWYSKTPMISSDIRQNDLPNAKLELQSHYEILFFQTYLGIERAIACFLVDKETGGFVLGLSTGRKRLDHPKALQEAIINLEFGDGGKKKGKLIEELERDGFVSLAAHRSYWLYKSIFPSWMLEDSTPRNFFNREKVKYDTTFRVLAHKPFKVIQAKNESLIGLHLGLPTERDLTILTRNTGNGKPISGNHLIHPIP